MASTNHQESLHHHHHSMSLRGCWWRELGWFRSIEKWMASPIFQLLVLLISLLSPPAIVHRTAAECRVIQGKAMNTESRKFSFILGAHAFVRATRKTGPDDLLNSAIAGFGTGAILGRLQCGRSVAHCYSLIFAVAGTAVDFAILKLRPKLLNIGESMFDKKNRGPLKLAEWSPIQVLDEEALAAK
ncbi:hypothetical protein REPUB_Repub17cG0057400 [Reevesia pubescens]